MAANDQIELLMKVQVNPADKMVIKSTFEEITTQELVITNPTDSVITFKLKETSPGIIMQKPGYGYINPKDKVVITVYIASLRYRKKLPVKQRITAMLAIPPADKPPKAYDVWKNAEIANSARRHPIRLKFKRKKVKKDKGGKEEKDEDESAMASSAPRQPIRLKFKQKKAKKDKGGKEEEDEEGPLKSGKRQRSVIRFLSTFSALTCYFFISILIYLLVCWLKSCK